MVSTFIYWAVFAALAAWGLWSLVFSCVYLSNHENGNLWFFAIINAILGLLGWLFAWIMSNTAHRLPCLDCPTGHPWPGEESTSGLMS